MTEISTIREAFDYDPGSGVFTWRAPKPGTRAKVGMVAGYRHPDGYVRLSLFGKAVSAHRAAWMHFYGAIPTKNVDHINGDKGDNRIANLRLADLCENNWNRKAKKAIGGLNPKPSGKVHALIRHRGKKLYLGSFATPEEARAAYQEAATRLRGAFHE